MAVRNRFIFNLQFAQQILDLLMNYARFLRFVGKPDEGYVCSLCAVGLVQAVGFSHLSFGTDTVNSVVQSLLCYADEYLHTRFRLVFPCNIAKDHADRIVRDGL